MSRYKVNQTTGALEELIAGAEEIDGTLSSTSTKAIQNRAVNDALVERDTAIADNRPLPIKISSVAALPRTITSSKIKSNHVVEGSDMVLSNPSAQLSYWEVATSNGSLTISGTIGGTTDISFNLVPSQDALTF